VSSSIASVPDRRDGRSRRGCCGNHEHRRGRCSPFPFLLAALTFRPLIARAAETPERIRFLRDVRDAKIRLIWDEARERMNRDRDAGGERLKPAPPEGPGTEGWLGRAGLRPEFSLPLPRLASIPANVRCNDPSLDGTDAGQCEEAVAVRGLDVLVAWNDGQGFIGPYEELQGYGYSTDGGATFTDGGFPPPPAPGLIWESDPIVTVDEKTGDFYFSALIADSLTRGDVTNGIGIVRGTFVGATLVWGSPHVVEAVSSNTDFLDKEWIAADSTNGHLYLTYTHFTTTSDSIVFRRSLDGGATWGPKLTLSSATGAGSVQGSRPAVGPAGEVYVVWLEAGPVATDFFRIRKSVDGGSTFAVEKSVTDSIVSNFGSGAPGFNRPGGLDFPSIAVDRTTGPHRGRVYVAWNEPVYWFDDPLGTGGSKSEVEPDGSFSSATFFTIGQRLRGTLSVTGDVDLFSFSATQGTTYIFWCDSIPNPTYALRVICGADTATRLAYTAASGGGHTFIVWTAPMMGVFYLRMFMSGGTTGGYRIETGVDSPTPGDRARDHRDALVAHSDDVASWTAVRVNDESPWLDDWLPEVMVGSDGDPYAIWFDWRDAAPVTCGGGSTIYVSRSIDGGASWAASQRIASAVTSWSFIGSNIIPNQGDYSHMAATGSEVRSVWADGRGGNPDVFTAAVGTDFAIGACRSDTTVAAGGSVNVSISVTNRNGIYSNDFTLSLTSQRNWPLPASAPLTVAAGSSGSTSVTLAVPDSAAPGTNLVCAVVANASGSITRSCCFDLGVSGPVAVGGRGSFRFALAPSVPNPAPSWARIDYELPRSEPATIRIYGLRGERVRTLLDGMRPAGPGSVIWDGRDGRGNPAAPGAYFYRLEAGGLGLTRRLVVMR
jgi:hypothetical protein